MVAADAHCNDTAVAGLICLKAPDDKVLRSSIKDALKPNWAVNHGSRPGCKIGGA
jgi:hypothetical protein